MVNLNYGLLETSQLQPMVCEAGLFQANNNLALPHTLGWGLNSDLLLIKIGSKNSGGRTGGKEERGTCESGGG